MNIIKGVLFTQVQSTPLDVRQNTEKALERTENSKHDIMVKNFPEEAPFIADRLYRLRRYRPRVAGCLQLDCMLSYSYYYR